MRYHPILDIDDEENYYPAFDFEYGIRGTKFFIDEDADGSGRCVEMHYHPEFIKDLIHFFLSDDSTRFLLLFLFKCLVKKDNSFEWLTHYKPSRILRKGGFSLDVENTLVEAYYKISPRRYR